MYWQGRRRFLVRGSFHSWFLSLVCPQELIFVSIIDSANEGVLVDAS